jgi:hypothetical protein
MAVSPLASAAVRGERPGSSGGGSRRDLRDLVGELAEDAAGIAVAVALHPEPS